MLLANGWFLQPKPFDQRRGVDTVRNRQRNALIRIPFFVGGWIAAAVFLPTWLDAVAFAGWVTKVWPGIRTVHEVFQNVGPDEEPA
jgi:hypothetical protein